MDQEIKQILQTLDNKEALLQVISEKEKLLASEYESLNPAQPSQMMSNGPPLSRVLEQVDQDEKESDLKM